VKTSPRATRTTFSRCILFIIAFVASSLFGIPGLAPAQAQDPIPTLPAPAVETSTVADPAAQPTSVAPDENGAISEAPTAVIEVVATPEPTEPPIFTPNTQDDPLVRVVSVGETLHSLAAQSGFSVNDLAERNFLTNPNLLLAGQKVRLPTVASSNIRLHRVAPGETLMSIAAEYNVSPYFLRQTNSLACSTCLVFGQLLRVPTTEVASNLPEPFERVEVSPIVPRQGDVIEVRVASRVALESISGAFGERPLRFTLKDGMYVALTGVGALEDPGVYPIAIRAITTEGIPSVVSGRVQVGQGRFGFENLTVGQKLVPLLDPQVNVDERAQLDTIFSQFSGTQWWQGPFQWPVSGKVVSYYGTRRNFNRGSLHTFHSGIDISAANRTPIKAAAPGRVAAVQPFKIRGNVVILDHGRGVFTVYCHLSRPNVTVGQIVDVGEVIGFSGNTGRSLGPHLHWELAVGGVTVNPLTWLREPLP
jgi:murein DD-endopeptidase MepM/ murein hydrolase activator NlpD